MGGSWFWFGISWALPIVRRLLLSHVSLVLHSGFIPWIVEPEHRTHITHTHLNYLAHTNTGTPQPDVSEPRFQNIEL